MVALVATFGVLRWSSGTSERGILPQERFITSYSIVYEIEEYDTPRRTEERVVKRPYFSKVVSRREGTVLTGAITNEEGRWVLLPDGQGWHLHSRGRQRPADDPRPIEALEAAVTDGRAEGRGTDVVLGRRCTIVRTGAPLGRPLEAPTAKEYADLCVDPTGAILRERWVHDGRLARLTVATTFTVDLPLDEEDFDPRPIASALPDAVPAVTEVRAVADGEPLPVPVRGVGGYRDDGPPLVIERKVVGRGRVVTYSQSFVRGGRLVVAEHGVVYPGFVPRGTPVDLADGVTGHLDLGLNSSTLTIVFGRDHYLRLRGAELDVLEAFGNDVARRLT